MPNNRKSSTSKDRNERTSNKGRARAGGNMGSSSMGGSSGGSSGGGSRSRSTSGGMEMEESEESYGSGRGSSGRQGGRSPSGDQPSYVSNRKTGKPYVEMTQASQTVPLRTCADVLNETLSHCLEKGGRHTDPDHLKCMIDAAYFCVATADFVSRGSPWADEIKQLCADIVKEAEESCEEFEDDEMMVACADTCRECYNHLTS